MITSAALTAAVPVAAHFGAGFGFPWFAILIPIFWILLFVLVFGVFGRRWRRAAWASGRFGPNGHGGAASAESVLAERFARGDVDEVEYRARLEVLRASREPRP
ncbi:SHOCT domain-containing protein [Naasia lichenicola]|uniref:SHOCT domain-containing protein n=1 Tax=Naasia lichenicola TaxID=2565933 RepID=A0A4S4FR64_9MICO|nr:hypothetical protein [Naasia lichenicola]THG32392.1 hypothetical protein E6C64_05090 [Naasia lichenicola]